MRYTVLLAVTVALTATGATLAGFGLEGWSESGMYLAWQQHGCSDGSGLPWAVLEVVRVPDGETVYRAEYFPAECDWTCPPGDEGREMGPEEALLEEARPLMDSLGIVPGSGGDLLVCHPLTDFTADRDSVRFYGGAWSPDYHGPEYLLTLEMAASGTEQVPDWFPPPVLLELTLELVGGETVVLASDQAPAPGYEYVYGYGIREVRTHSGRFVAVVLDTVLPGFEGADGAFRVVTGVLPGTPRSAP
jgi:hypothetical protein